MRRLTMLALLLTIIATLPATAAPVSVGRLASVRFSLAQTGGGEMRVELTVSRTDLGDRIELGVESCFGDGTCTASTYYAGTLPSGALQLDAKDAKGSLRAALRSTPLSAGWEPATEGSVVIGATHLVGAGDGSEAVALHRDDPAVVRLTLGTRACTGPGYVGDAVQVATGDSERTARPLSALRLPAGALRCTTPEPLV